MAGICESYSFMTTNTSKTPKTDSQCGYAINHYGTLKNNDLFVEKNGPFVHADFAREMEKILRDTLAAFKIAVNEVISYGPDESDDEYCKLIKRAEDFLGKS